jgi:quinol monooxygenase YgiN
VCVSSTVCSVVELRRYALHPGARETLIDLFDRELVETQEAVGIEVLGQFRDLDDPDSFVWLRGFRDMPARAQALEAFYGGPVWRRHRDAANSTMVDSDNVLLLRPVDPSSLKMDRERRPPPGTRVIPPGMVTVTICHPSRPVAEGFHGFFRRELGPALRATGADVIAAFATEPTPNNFPSLPIREGEEVFVWLSRFRSEAAHAGHLARFDLSGPLANRAKAAPETWRLSPTSRSLLNGSRAA